jgi:hypothetical protein
VRDLQRDSRASIRVDIESAVAVGGVRETPQIGGRGEAELRRQGAKQWTYRITLKYVRGEDGQRRAEMRAAQDRVLIVLR